MGNHPSSSESKPKVQSPSSFVTQVSCDSGNNVCQRKAFETCAGRSNFDPVISRRQIDRTGPNPDPTYCYLQKTMGCQDFKSQ